jgi:putative ABC transport system permease protein
MFSLLQIAIRNVLRNKRRTAITLAALLIGVSVMVSIRGTLNGLQRSLVQNVVKGQTGALQVHRVGFLKNVLSSPLSLDMPQDAAFEQKLLGVQHVTAISPRILFAGMINVGEQTIFLGVQAVDPLREFKVVPLREATLEDKGLFAGGKVTDAMVVTDQLEKALKGSNVPKDAPAALLAPDKDGALSGENVTLTGMMRLNMPGEKKIGMVRLDVAQRLLKTEGRATEYIVAVDDIDNLKQVASDLRTVLGTDYEVSTWAEIALFVKEAMARQDFILSLVAAVFLILMLLGVANTMLMSVLDRTREIGTMMAVGVRRSKILGLFLMEAATIGALGGVVGGGLGALIVLVLHERGISITFPGSNVPFTIQPFVTPQYLLGVISLAGLGALLFAVYPAWRASRLRPVEALAGG